MQQKLKISEEDLKHLHGAFLLRVNNKDFKTSTLTNGIISDFHLENRIVQLIKVKEGSKKHETEDAWILAGLYSPFSNEMTPKELIKKINSEYDDRHYRLMTLKEVTQAYKQKLNKISQDQE